MDLLGVNPVEGRSVFLKPNFNSADPTPGSTHLDTLRTLIERLKAMGAASITIGDRSGMGDTRGAMQQLGVFDLAEALGVETLVFDELEAEDWVHIQPTGSHWKDGFYFNRQCLEAEAVVQTCCLKTHQFGGHFSMSLKNSVGLVAKTVPGMSANYMNQLHTAFVNQRRMIAEINAAYNPALILLDGVEAFVTGGPAQGERVWSEVVLAGTDRVAVDAVGVAILRHFGTTRKVSRGPIFEQGQIARAVELGLGVDSPEKIQLITGDADSREYADKIMKVLNPE
jgi:uncharacterized protein (DUF362 family)